MGSCVPDTHSPDNNEIALLNLKAFNGNREFPSRRFDDQGNFSSCERLRCQKRKAAVSQELDNNGSKIPNKAYYRSDHFCDRGPFVSLGFMT